MPLAPALKSREFAIVTGLAFLAFFAQLKDFQLLFDGLTYFSLSKNILTTGDWQVLHYSPEQYTDFYQHPPLAIWLQAWVIRLFGDAEWVARILPSTFALGTVWVGFLFLARHYTIQTAFWFSIVLITSTRYLKWGTNFYLDGIMGFFIWAGVLSWLAWMRSTRAYWLAGLSGALLALALMTKGVVALAGVAGVGLAAAWMVMMSPKEYALPRVFTGLLAFLAGILLPLLIWGQGFGGWSYIEYYLKLSVADRVRTSPSPEGWIHPWRNIYSLWLPWWPLALGTLFASLRSWDRFKQSREMWCLALIGLMFPVGLGFGSIYLEHYLTPFYPFAAFVAAIGMERITRNQYPRALKGFSVLTLLVAFALATIAPAVHVAKDTPVVRLISEIRTLSPKLQDGISTVAVSQPAAEIWSAIATIQGKTRYRALGNFDPKRSPPPNTVLLLKKQETPSVAWTPVPCLWVDDHRIYFSPDLQIPCRD